VRGTRTGAATALALLVNIQRDADDNGKSGDKESKSIKSNKRTRVAIGGPGPLCLRGALSYAQPLVLPQFAHL
jgi:hypothetical protein